jgi:hypothetical protein
MSEKKNNLKLSTANINDKYYPPMKHKHVTTKEIQKIIQSLATKDSNSSDGIPNRI